MSLLDFKNMDISEKFMLLEELWEDMSKNIEASNFSPNWHLDILAERENKVKANKAEFYTLDEIKKEYKSLK